MKRLLFLLVLSFSCMSLHGQTEEGAVPAVEEEWLLYDNEVKPLFQGEGTDKFSEWVSERLIYPEAAKKNRVKGRVDLQFMIFADGSIGNVEVVKGAGGTYGHLLDQEAVRVVSMSPKWTPATQNGKPVSVKYTFPVIFRRR